MSNELKSITLNNKIYDSFVDKTARKNGGGFDPEGLSAAVEAALAEAKASGEFDGKDGKDGYTPVKGVDYFDGAKGEDGKDYELTDADKEELAQMAADTVDVPEKLPNPNALTINGETYDGSKAVNMELAKGPLVGDYDEITPSQVAEAVAENRVIEITNVDEIYRNFYISGNEVIGSLLDWSNVRLKVIKGAIDTNKWVFSNTGELANTMQIPTELKNPNKLTINGNEYDGSEAVDMELAKPSDIPIALKNPNALTINGETYDGSEAVDMELAKPSDIPTIPSALKNPNKLTINGTEYDGSEEVSVSVAKEPLVGTLNNCAPQDVAEAIAEGRPISLTILINGVEHTFTSFGMRDGKILSEIIFQTGDDRREISVAYIEGEFFSDGTGHWNLCVTGQLARMDDVPTALKNPSKLIINGEEYDGSKQIIMNLAKPSDIPSALKNPNALTINGTEYDGSSAVNMNLAKEPLIGSEIEITPSMVADAVQEGRSVVLRCEAFDDTFTSFSILNDKYVVGGAINTGNVNGLQLVCAYGNIETDAWAFAPRNLVETKDIPSIPSALKNPNALTFTGAVTESYDGSEAKTVNIPTVPSALKNPNTLTINGIAYDGSSAVSMELAKLSDIPEVEWMATVPEISGGSVVMETNLNFTSKYHTLNPHWKPVVGYNYDIYWNDDKYTCAIVESSGEAFVGNRSLMSSSYPDTGEPFLFTGWALTNPELTAVQKATATAETVSLRIETEYIVKCDKLPEVYLPDCVVKSVNGETPDKAGNIAITALKNPNKLTINGTAYDGSKAVNIEIREGVEPLIGTTEEITPAQVVQALIDGRPITLAHTDTNTGNTFTFNHFSAISGVIAVGSAVVVLDVDTPQLVQLTGFIDSTWLPVVYRDIARLEDVPEKLPNPYQLTINGTTYDGSSEVSVDTIVRVAFTYYKEAPVTGMERVFCDTTPSELASVLSKSTVIAELKDESGAYIGSAVFGRVNTLPVKAVADIVTAEKIYRILGDSTKDAFGVELISLASGADGGIVIFEEATVSSMIVNNLSFELGAEYDIYWNDKKYVCTSYTSDGEVYTGNGHIINTNLPDTGEPFLFTHMAGAASCLLHKASGQASSNKLFVATHGYNPGGGGGGGADIDVTADAGQVLLIDEVNVNGKPLSWKAADYPFGSREIVSLSTYTPTFDGDFNIYTYELEALGALEVGKQYVVWFDGVKYTCAAKSGQIGMSDSIVNVTFIGNGAILGEPTNDPFALASIVGYDGYVIVFGLDGNEHTIKVATIPKLFKEYAPTIEDMYTSTSVGTIYDGTVTIENYTKEILGEFVSIELGKTYTVTFDGTEHTCVGLRVDYNGLSAIALGNVSLVDTSYNDTGEPFVIAAIPGVGWGVASANGDHTIHISGEVEVVEPIPYKFLTECQKKICDVREIEIVPPCSFSMNGNEYVYIPYASPVTGGMIYPVNYNGTIYECECIDMTSFAGMLFLGNMEALDGNYTGTGVPFIIGFSPSDGIGMFFPFDGAQNVTLSVIEEHIEKIPSKYLDLSEIEIPEIDMSNIPKELPEVTTADNGAFLRVINGAWAIDKIPNVEDGEF